MNTDLQKTFWTDAAKSGLVLGLVIVIFSVISWLLRLDIDASWAPSLFNFASIGICIYVYGKKRAGLYQNEGFSYGQSMSFIFAIMLFAGFVSGVGAYLMHNHVAPEYFKEVMDASIAKSGLNIDSTEMDMAMGMAQKLMKSAVFIVLSSLFNMIIYGCFIGLIASIFIKKDPNPFSNQNNAE